MRDDEVKVSVLIPAFNEAAAVRAAVTGIAKTLHGAAIDHEIIVVDDGSSDGTAQEAALAGATVLSHPVNGGYGRAVQTGLRHSSGDIVAILAADGSYPPGAVPGVIAGMFPV